MKTTSELISLGMAKAFFACAWADVQEEKDSDDETRVNLSGKEIFNEMPEAIDPAAIHAATALTFDLIRANNKPELLDVYLLAAGAYDRAEKQGDRELNPEIFGHYLAMQAMGTGVGLESFGDAVRDAVTVPYVEFGSHSLTLDY